MVAYVLCPAFLNEGLSIFRLSGLVGRVSGGRVCNPAIPITPTNPFNVFNLLRCDPLAKLRG